MAKQRQKNRPPHTQKPLSPDKANKLFTHGHFEAALPLYKELLKQQPNNPDILYSTGFTYYACKQYNKAAEALQKLLTLMPNHEKGRRMLLASLNDGKLTGAMLNMAKEIKVAPLNDGEYLQAFSAFLSVCDWDNALPMLNRCVNSIISERIPAALLPGFLMDILGVSGISCKTMHTLTKQTAKLSAHNIKPLPIKKEPHINNRIKLAYLSTDFRAHPVGYFIYSILAAHNKCHFEVFCYSGSTIQDSVTKLIKDEANHFIDVSNLNEEEIAHHIYNDGIHVLVELGGYTESSNLKTVAYRPAPVSIAYLGYANSTGYSSMDFRITDPYVDTPDGTIYSETLLTLPNSFLCFGMRPSCERNQQAPVDKNGFITFGSFNHNRKLNPKVIETWSKILNRVSNSRLMLKGNWRSGTLSNNVLKQFKSHKINPEKIIFLPYTVTYDDHVACYNEVDIALDTFPYSGTTTTCEALWMGVPVITLVGNSHQSRVSYSILKNIGFEETITLSEEEYINKAVKLANNPEGLSILRPMLHTLFEHSPTARPDLFTPELEAVYLDACHKKGVDVFGINNAGIQADNLQGVSSLDTATNKYDQTEINPEDYLPGSFETRTLLECDQLSASLWGVIHQHCTQVLEGTSTSWLILAIPDTENKNLISEYIRNHFIIPHGDENETRLYLAIQSEGLADNFVPALAPMCHKVHHLNHASMDGLDHKDWITPFFRLLPPVEDYRITICIPTYNRCKLLKRTVDSALAQTYSHFELLIVDDASSDGTEKYCRKLSWMDKRVRYHRNSENLGLFANHVLAFNLIHTEFYVISSDDDFLYQDHLKRTVEMMRKKTDLGMVFGQTGIGDVNEAKVQSVIPHNYTTDCVVAPQQMLLDSVLGNQICWTSALIRKSAVENMILYAEEYLEMNREATLIGEGDYFFGLLMTVCAPVAYVHFPASFFSTSTDSYSGQQLGGGWGLEIRLHTVSYLLKMYRSIYDVDIYIKPRLGVMVQLFKQQMQTIRSSLSDTEMTQHQQKLLEFDGVIDTLEKEAF